MLLLIAFMLPFDNVTDVHHYEEEKINMSLMRKIKANAIQPYLIYNRFTSDKHQVVEKNTLPDSCFLEKSFEDV